MAPATSLPSLTPAITSKLYWFYLYLRGQFFSSTPLPEYDFKDQVVLVTGANTGIGLEVARHFARLNAAKIILAVRNVAKGQAAVEDIIGTTGVSQDRLEVWQVDQADFKSVLRLGKRVSQIERLDAIVLNAGILTTRWEEVEGLENHIAINTVAPTLLAMLLLPKLQQSARQFGSRGRLCFNGSDTSYIANFKPPKGSKTLLQALSTAMKSSGPGNRYAVSKILQVYAARHLARACPLTPDSDVVITVAFPGQCNSDLLRDDMGWLLNWAGDGLMWAFAHTCEIGARRIVHAVRPGLGEEYHGRLLAACEICRNGSNVDSAEGKRLAEIFEKELLEKLESVESGVTRL